MRRIDDAADEQYWKIAITGPGGTGKTTLGVSAPKPLIVLSERQGLPSIKQAAKRLGVPVPPVVFVDDAVDYRTVLKALRAPKDKPFVLIDRGNGEVVMELPVEDWPQTVIVDSLTDACDVVKRELDDQSPNRKDRSGLPVMSRGKWGVWTDRCMGLVKGFRDLPMHVVFLCLLSDRTKEDDDGNIIERIIQPKLATHGMGPQLCAAVNLMGYTRRKMDGGAPVYAVLTIAPEHMLSKPCEPLQQWEVPDLSSWIDRLNGNLTVAPDFPDMSGGNVPTKEPETEAPDEPQADDGPGEPEAFPACVECGRVAVGADGDMCGGCEALVFGDEGPVDPSEPEPDAGAPEVESKPKGAKAKRAAKKAGK